MWPCRVLPMSRFATPIAILVGSEREFCQLSMDRAGEKMVFEGDAFGFSGRNYPLHRSRECGFVILLSAPPIPKAWDERHFTS
jgi:hypothetical protein